MGNNFSKEQQYENDQGGSIIQQIIDFHTQRVNEAGITKDYETILSELDIIKYLLSSIPAEDELNLYQALVLDTILHCNYDVTSQISASEIVTNDTIELFKVLIEIVKNYLTLFGEIELNKLPTRNYKTYKQSLEISYNSLAFFKRIRDAEHLKDLEEIFNDLEQKKYLLEEKANETPGLTFYQKLILELLEKGTKLNQDIQEDNFIEWLSSKFEKYADLFEHIPRDQLPFDYYNSKHLFKIKHESLLLTSKLKLAPNWSQIEEIIQLLKEFKAKHNYSIEHLNNELFFYHDILFITTLKKALDIYNDTSENLSIEESIEFLEQLLDQIKFIDMTSTPDSTNEKWIEAINEYIIIKKQLEANYDYLICEKTLLSEQDMNKVLNLADEKKDILELALTEEGELNLYQKIIIKTLTKWYRNYDDIEEDKMIDFFSEMLIIQDRFKDYFMVSENIYLTSFASLYVSTKLNFDWALVEKMFYYEFNSEESLNVENFTPIVKRQKYLINEYEVLPLDKKILFFYYSTKIFLIIAKNISSFKRNGNSFKEVIEELLNNIDFISAKSSDIPQEIIDQDTVLGLTNIKQFLQQKNLITFLGKIIHEAYCQDLHNDPNKLEIINLWLDYVHGNIIDEQYKEEQIYRTLRTMHFKALFLRDEYADGISSTETIETAEKLIIEFCQPTEDPEVRKVNVALRIFTYFVSKNSSPILGIPKAIAKLGMEIQIQFTRMLIESLKINDSGKQIVSLIDNGLVYLLDDQYVLISYLDAKNSISLEELDKVKAILTDDLFENVLIAKIYINNKLYEDSKNQISSIFNILERQEFEKEYILSVLRIVDYFRDMFIYHKDISFKDPQKIAFVENCYNKLYPLITFNNEIRDAVYNRIIKMYVISGNVEKTISLMQEVAENRQEYKNCLELIGSITSEEDILKILQSNTDLIAYQEVSSLRQLLETRKNTFPQRMIEVQLYAKTLVEQKLDIFYQQIPEKKQQISKPDINEINQKIQDLKPKHLLIKKSSIVQTDHYHIDVTLVPETTNMFKLEIQGRGVGGVDKKTIAQVLYDPDVLNYDTDVIGNKIILLLKKALAQSNIAEIGKYYCQQYDVRQANQFEILHRGSSLQLQKNSLDYMFDYNELALKNLLELRLELAVEEYEISKNIKVLEAKIVDIHHNEISTQTKIIAMSDSIIRIYNIDKAIKHILIPILIPKNTLVYHWVGVAVTKEENKLSIAYLDSENCKDIVPLQTILTYNLQKLFPHLYVSFTQISLEQQKYNNCGLELIENFVFYLTRARVSQEEAPYLHNDLWLQKLIFDQIKLDRNFAEGPLISYSLVQRVNLLEKQTNAENMPHQLAKSAAAYINKVADQIDLNWEFKKWIYLKDITKFNQIMQKYNIERSVDELKDLETSFYSFSIDLEDKELERDVLFVANLKEKLNLPAGTKEIEYLQPFIYKLNIAIKITDTAVDLTRLFYIPTIENTQKTLMDISHIYSMYTGINGLSLIPIGYEAINKYLQLGLGKTLIHVGPQLVKTLGYMILPTMIASFGISHIGFTYSVGLTIYGGFNAIDNMKSLYNEFYQKDFNLNSNIAYQNLAEKLSTTCLQNLYDFASKAKDYEKAVYKIKLEEKGEFGKKLYEYVYSRVIDEKYDLQNNSKAKQIKIMDYDHCIEIIEFKEEKLDHYYCYNEEQEILDHIVIIGEVYIQKSTSL